MLINSLLITLTLLLNQVTPWCLKTIFAGTSKTNSIDFSPDGQYILTAHSSGKLLLWHSKTLQILHTYDFGHEIYEAVFSKSQQDVAVGGASTEVHILNPSTLAYVTKIDAGHDGKVYDLDFQYDSSKLMTCGDDKKAKFWRTSDWSKSNNKQVTLHHEVYTCQWGDTEKFVGAGPHFVTSYPSNYWTGKHYQIHDDGTYEDFWSARVRPGSDYAILADNQGNFIEIFMDDAGPNTRAFTETSGNILALGYSQDASYFIATGDLKKIYVYNGTNRVNELVQIIETDSTSSFVSARFSYDSNYFAVGNQNGSVYLYQRFCQGCPVGTFRNIDECSLCTQALVGCAVCKNSTKCLGCYGGYYLSGLKCKSCDILEGCAVCLDFDECTQCLPGFFLDGQVCKRCLDHHKGCYQCLNAATCLQCDFNYFLDNTNTCVRCFTIDHCIFCNDTDYCLQCIVGYYEDDGVCTDCPVNCKSCQAADNCTECIGGYFSSSGTCTLCTQPSCIFCNNTDYCFDCSQNFYAAGGNCVTCIHPCASCNSSTYCHSCVIGYYLSASGVCTNCPAGCLSCNTTAYCHSCDIGYYLHAGTNTCKKCSQLKSNCRECNTTTCISCEPQHYYHSGSSSCVLCSVGVDNCQICRNGPTCQFCLPGFYLQTNSTCHICEQGCQACKSSTQCSVCEPGYYLSSEDCLLCQNNCVTCTDSTNCLSCVPGMYENSGSCYYCSAAVDNCTSCQDATHCVECSLGYYLSSATSCGICDPPCISCITSASTCLKCDEGFYLAGTSCSPCSSQCTICTASATNCQSCVLGFYLDSVNQLCLQCTVPGCQSCLDSTECIICQNYYYESSGDCLTCSSLISHCLRCNSVTTTCSLCQYGFALSSSDTVCSQCSVSLPNCEHCETLSGCETCMLGFYPDVNGDCQPCLSGCQSCLDANTCEICIQSYVENGGKCYLCEEEMMGCGRCSSKTVCTNCVNGYYLNGNKCSLCRSSMQGCEVCEDFDTCTLCSLFYEIQADDSCKLCSEVYLGCQVCDGAGDDNNKAGCLECQMGYYLSYTTSGVCVSCGVTDPGCTKCLDVSTCEECANGYYLSLLNNCIECQTTYTNCIYCNVTECLQCEAGFYLLGGSCSPCSSQGCEICVENSPTDCLTCNSHYTLVNSTCELCSLHLSNCMQCSDNLTCTQCSSGYYVNSSDQCQLCSETFEGCTYCTSAGCQSCISNYFVNQSQAIPSCTPCFSFIKGCSFCVSEVVCLSCQNGYYYDSAICISCTEIYGCLYCENSTECIHCQQGYFLDNSTCFLCSQEIPGCYACDERSMCSSCQGHYELVGGNCIEIEGQVVQEYAELELSSYYIDEETLKHTLYTRKGMKYEAIDLQWEKQAELTIVTQEYEKIPLTIKKGEFNEGSDALTFTTDNPIGAALEKSLSDMPMFSAVNGQGRRLLVGSNVDLNYQFKLFMTQQAVHDILPNLDHLGDLYLETPLSEPEFYKTFIEKKNYHYFIIGLSVTLLLILIYVVKVTCLVPKTPNRGQIIPHLMAIRVGALALYPTFPEYINFCYGFMSSDLPWANDFFASYLSEQSDVIPEPFQMYYVSLSLGSTYILALIAIIVLWSVLAIISFVCTENNPMLKLKINGLKSVFYNLFIFGAITAGCLSLQGAILNPITQLSLTSFSYILGIILYVGILFQIFYSIFCEKKKDEEEALQPENNQETILFNSESEKRRAKQEANIFRPPKQKTVNVHKIYKLRVYIKATALSLLHLNPLYFFICLFAFEIFSILVQHFIARKDRISPRMETICHILADIAIGINIFLPDALIGLISVTVFAGIIIFMDLFCIYSEYSVDDAVEKLAIKFEETKNKEDFSISIEEKSQPMKQTITLSSRKPEQKKKIGKKKVRNYPKEEDFNSRAGNQQNGDTFVFAEL